MLSSISHVFQTCFSLLSVFFFPFSSVSQKPEGKTMKTICDILGPFPSNQMNHNVPSKKKNEKRTIMQIYWILGIWTLQMLGCLSMSTLLRGKLFILFFFSCQKNVLRTLQRKRYSLWHFQFFGLATFWWIIGYWFFSPFKLLCLTNCFSEIMIFSCLKRNHDVIHEILHLIIKKFFKDFTVFWFLGKAKTFLF